MVLRTISLSIACLISILTYSQSNNWLITSGTGANEMLSSMVVADTNVFICGTGMNNFYISNYNTQGALKWSNFGSGDALMSHITSDANENIYVIGSFSDSIVVFKETTLTSDTTFYGSSTYNFFALKYDKDGSLLWGTHGSGEGENYGHSIDFANNFLLFSGSFADSINISDGTTLMTVDAGFNSFIGKIDTENGNIVWIKQTGGIEVNSISTDAEKHIFTTGRFENTTSFDGINITSSSAENAFVTKYDSNGTAIWADGFGGIGGSVAQGNDLGLDQYGNVYLTGKYVNVLNIGNFSFTVANGSAYGSSDIFIAKYNTLGNVEWAKIVGGGAQDEGNTIYVDDLGNIGLAGKVRPPGGDSLIFMEQDTLIGFGNTDIFVAQLNSHGEYTTAFLVGGASNNDDGTGVYINDTSFYFAGNFNGVIYFPGDTGVTSGGTDIFLTRYENESKVTSINMHTKGFCENLAHEIFVSTQGIFNPGNIFTLTLSDTLGQFDNNDTIHIGSVNEEKGPFSFIFTTNGNLPFSGTYKVKATSSAPAREYVLDVNYFPVSVSLGNDTIICNGESLNISLPAANYYLWNDESTSNMYSINSAGTYSVQITDTNLCNKIDSIEVNYVAPRDLIVEFSHICQWEDSKDQIANEGFISYEWSNGGGVLGTERIYPATVTNMLTIEAIDSNNCVQSAAQNVIKGIVEEVDLDDDPFFCGDTTNIILNGPSNSFLASYLWQDGSTSRNFTATEVGIYYLTATEDQSPGFNTGCVSSDTIELISQDSLELELGNDTAYCNYDTITLNAGSLANEYSWSTGATTSSIIPLNSGTYSVMINNACGSLFDTIDITINKPPVVITSEDVTICQDESTTLVALGGTSYQWSPANSLDNSSTSTVVASPENTTTYMVSVTNDVNCTSEETIVVTVDNCTNLDAFNTFIQQVNVFPNPSISGQFSLNITLPYNNINISILNALGQEVISAQYNTYLELITFDETLSQGIYFIQLEIDHHKLTQKLVVKR